MKNLVLIITIILSQKKAEGQFRHGFFGSEISQAIHINDSENIKNRQAEKIIEHFTEVWLTGDIRKMITEKKLNHLNQCVYSYTKNFIQDTLKSEYSNSYRFKNEKVDSVIFKLKFVADTFWRIQTYKYNYDKDGNIVTKLSYMPYGQVEKISFKSNSLDYPTTALIERRNGKRIQESAKYLRDRNEIQVTQIAKHFGFDYIDTIIFDHKIDYKFPKEERRYNSYGDIVYEKIESGYYHYEYEYDFYHNWLKCQKYFVDLHRLEVNIKEITVREINYKKEKAK